MLEAINKATHHIHLQSFIIGRDKTGIQFMDALAAKAREGVRVRILYDRFGSTYAHWFGFFRRYRKTPNMSIKGWTLYNPLRRSFMINLRNHRKQLIIDGKQGFMGGVNLHDGNTTQDGKEPIRDYHFAVEGPVVHDMQYTFMRDWYCMTDEQPEQLFATDYFPHLPSAGPCLTRLINSGPSSEMEVQTDLLFSAVINAERQILIATPYLVPSNDLLRALRSVALRGVDVRVVVPKNNNHAYVALASRGLYAKLLQSGVRVFERKGNFMHAKALVIDDRFALIGTPNWDVRSLRLSYESALAIQNEPFASELKQIVLADIASSEEIELNSWQRRPTRKRMLENVCLLMRPVL
jgi:cardiolipin synthase